MDGSVEEIRLTGVHGDFSVTSNEFGSCTQFWLDGLGGFFGGVSTSSSNTQRTLGHGVFPEPSLRTGRVLTFGGLLRLENSSDTYTAQRYLSGLLWDGKFGELTVTLEGSDYSMQVKLDGEPKITPTGSNHVSFQIPLLAPDPFIYAPPRLYQIFPAGAGQGLVFPLFTTKAKASTGNLASFASTATSNGTVTAGQDGRQVLTVTREGNNFPGSFVLTNVPTTPGKNYTVKTSVQGSTPGTSYAIRTNIYGGSYASAKYFVTDSVGNIIVPAPVDSWDERTWLVTAPQGSTSLALTWFPIHPNGAQTGTQSITVEIVESTPVLDWGAGAPVGGAFANSGNADAHPVYTVHGSWSAGFRITTGSKVIEYPSPVVVGHPVVIDHKTGSVTVSGVDQTYRLSRRDWVAVPAGEAIQPRITGLAPSTGWCDITISDTYI